MEPGGPQRRATRHFHRANGRRRGRECSAVNRCWKEKGYKSADCAPADPNSVAALDPIIALCHNPVRKGDDPMCGREGLVSHQVICATTKSTSSPRRRPRRRGATADALRPLTGEVIQRRKSTSGTASRPGRAEHVDVIRWMNGELLLPGHER